MEAWGVEEVDEPGFRRCLAILKYSVTEMGKPADGGSENHLVCGGPPLLNSYRLRGKCLRLWWLPLLLSFSHALDCSTSLLV